MLDLKIGKPAVKPDRYEQDASIIRLGLIGNLTGTVILNLEQSTAIEIVSKMMMMPVTAIDEIGQSAMAELGNMVAGNAATIFANSNVIIDITTPGYYQGGEYPSDNREVFSIPFSCEAGEITVDIFINESA